MTTAWHSPNIIHDGYMDGLYGKDPSPESEECEGYQDGYLLGAEDREKYLRADPQWKPPKYLGPCEDLPIQRKAEVYIPKGTLIKTIYHGERRAGRRYKVKLHDVCQGHPAYRDYSSPGDKIKRPTPPRLLWAGTGGYWSEADLNEVVE